ncbi:hypothetical protein M405DRAFT_845473 [Rhizopogon salebrosus TDB-379]|nr:hypothetical protein M405DRAFT_845473 [Rhizopogon salebrosus TDB-379]
MGRPFVTIARSASPDRTTLISISIYMLERKALTHLPGGLKEYEVEVQGMQDVQGDEEGLVTVSGDVSNSMNTDATSDRGVGDSYFLQSVTGDNSAYVEPLEMAWTLSSSLISVACIEEPIVGSLAVPSHGQEFALDGVALCQSLVTTEIGPH